MNAQATNNYSARSLLWHWACKLNSHDTRFDRHQKLYVELINDDQEIAFILPCLLTVF